MTVSNDSVAHGLGDSGGGRGLVHAVLPPTVHGVEGLLACCVGPDVDEQEGALVGAAARAGGVRRLRSVRTEWLALVCADRVSDARRTSTVIGN